MQSKNTFPLKHANESFIGMLLSFLLILPLLFSITASAVPSASELLEILKARDEQFDNAHLQYSTSGVMKVDAFPTWKFPGFAEDAQWSAESLKPQEIPVKFNEQLIVRAGDATFIRETPPELFPDEIKPGMSYPTPFSKWSNTEGLQREITNNFPISHERKDMTLEIGAAGREGDISQEQRTEIEFGHGFGFGKRITNIEEIYQDQDGKIVIMGSIKIWTHDKSTFRLTLDDNYVVREAYIEAFVEPVLNVIEITTEGLDTTGENVFPEKGKYKRTMWGVSEGERVGKGKVIKEFAVEFKEASFHLSDEQYAVLTNMDVPDGTWIMDKITGATYSKGKQPAPEPFEDFVNDLGLNLEGNLPLAKTEEDALPNPPVKAREVLATKSCNAHLKVDSQIEVYLTSFKRRLFDDEAIYAV